MNRTDKVRATKADAQYGAKNWQWADYVDDDYTGTILHASCCRCADCINDDY